MLNKLNYLLLAVIAILTISCAEQHKANQYPNSHILGYNPANPSNINDLSFLTTAGPSLIPQSERMDAQLGNMNPAPNNAVNNNFKAPYAAAPYGYQSSAPAPTQPIAQRPVKPQIPTAQSYNPYQAVNKAPPPVANNILPKNRRYPPLNNYPYPYDTGQKIAPIRNTQPPAPEAVQNPSPARYNNYQSQLNNMQPKFPEVTQPYNQAQTPKLPTRNKSRFNFNNDNSSLKLIDKNYFSPKGAKYKAPDNSFGYNNKIQYNQNPDVINNLDNSLLDNKIKNDSLQNQFRQRSLPSL